MHSLQDTGRKFFTPSPSESVSIRQPTSSTTSVSALFGQSSIESSTPSLSAERLPSFGKASRLSPTPSPSESTVSVPSFGKASLLSPTPSPSESTFRHRWKHVLYNSHESNFQRHSSGTYRHYHQHRPCILFRDASLGIHPLSPTVVI